MRLRLRSTKLGKIRFVSHRDAARIWERSFRRVGLPLVFTQGFTPRPKISFGLALPTCAESIAEYVDIELNTDTESAEMADIVDIDTLPTRLSAVLPLGFDVLAVAELDRADPDQAGSLQETVTSSTWELWSDRFTPVSIAAAPRLLDEDVLMVERERKGQRRTDDVRPLVLDLRPNSTGDRLVVELATIGRALRPSELAAAAFPDVDPLDVRVLRTHQWITHDGVRREVLSLPTDVAAMTERVFA